MTRFVSGKEEATACPFGISLKHRSAITNARPAVASPIRAFSGRVTRRRTPPCRDQPECAADAPADDGNCQHRDAEEKQTSEIVPEYPAKEGLIGRVGIEPEK